jgi:hypothetical protein
MVRPNLGGGARPTPITHGKVTMGLFVRVSAIAVAILAMTLPHLRAQAPQRGQPQTPASPREAAPIDLTGYWVSIVNEDWRWRMITPPKGDYASVPLNDDGRKMADTWQPAMDGRCEAYGAAALMRMPTRVHITWEGDNILKIETDAGQQTRRFQFQPATQPRVAPTLQGVSAAEWQFAGGRGGGRGPGGPADGGGRGGARGEAAGPRFGSLKVVTTNLRAGWLRKNGVPYSENAVVTEYYDRFKAPNGDEWFFVTTLVNDSKYLQQEFVTSSHFRKEPDGSKWSPSPCKTT